MAPQAKVDSHSLEKLQSAEQVRLLDQIDELRNQGLCHYGVSLPQLIVCGEQSSGKSSVLEGLTRLRFPVEDGIACTVFASEVVLRKEPTTSITCTIIPGRSRPEAERCELAKFIRSFTSLEDDRLPTVIKEAKEQMEFKKKAPFYEDVLRIRYCGPDLPSLTIVDLPGIIKGHESESAAKLVSELVRNYMSDPKSIILVVVPANQDYDTTTIPKYVNEMDENGTRTLGIITKPDRIEPGSNLEKQAIRLAKNERKVLSHGWHAVRNRGHATKLQPNADRDETERAFFNTGAWASVPKTIVGIASLRTKLSRILLEHIGTELPSLVATVQTAITATESGLKAIGKARNSPSEQRSYLIGHASNFQLLTNDALRGIYSNPFFALSNEQSTTRLRTEIQNLNIAFAEVMYRKGHKWTITDSLLTHMLPTNLDPTSREYDNQFDEPENIQRAKFLAEHIGAHVRQSRPAGLLSLVNPWVIVGVFREQSQAWGKIAERHLERIFQTVKAYIRASLGVLMDHRTWNMLMLKQIQPELDRRWTNVEAKLQELLVPYTEQDPITYDPAFVLEMKVMRVARHRAATSQMGSPEKSSVNTRLSDRYLLTLDDFTNSEILDLMQTYYKHAISVFINNIAVLAIENCLIKDLASIFSPSLIASLSDEKLFAMAAESEQVREERTSLEEKLIALKNGKSILNEHIATRPTALHPPPPPKQPTTQPLLPREPTPLPLPTPPQTSPPSPRPRTPNPPPTQTPSPKAEANTLASHFGTMGIMDTPPPTTKRPDSRADSGTGTPSPPPSVKERRKLSPRRRRAWPPTYENSGEVEDEEL